MTLFEKLLGHTLITADNIWGLMGVMCIGVALSIFLEQKYQWASKVSGAIIALLIASNPNAGSIMSLVSNAWGVFGAAFGPAIMLSLFWKRFNFAGAVAGIAVGAVVDVGWLLLLSSTGIYEIIPGFAASLLAAVIASLCTKKPNADVEALYDRAVAYEE